MSRVRVYELARELGIDSKTLIKDLDKLRIKVSSHQSTLTQDQVLQAKRELKQVNTTKKVVVKRRKKSLADSVEAVAPTSEEVQNTPDQSSFGVVKSPLERLDKTLTEKIVESESVKVSDSTDKQSVTSVEDSTEKDISPTIPKKDNGSSQAKENLSKTLENIEEKTITKFTSVEAKPFKVIEEKKKDVAKIIRKATPEESEVLRQRQSENKRPLKYPHSPPKTSEPRFEYKGKFAKSSASNSIVKKKPEASVVPEVSEVVDLAQRIDKSRGNLTRKKEEKEVSPRFKQSVSSRQKFQPIKNIQSSEIYNLDENPVLGKKKRVVVASAFSRRRSHSKKQKSQFKNTEITTPRAAYRVVKIVGSAITVANLAEQLRVKASEILKKLMDQGIMVTINQFIDFDVAALIASEYNFECKNTEKNEEDILKSTSDDNLKLVSRPPIVTVMGHVDHGKTSILDAIRKTGVVAKEAGGITQHIGAYMVGKKGSQITFLDTPGHAAFSAMRARGAQVTDIVVLVVAADDGVMPQSIEAIAHARSANVPIIVAVNKIDKPNINLDKVFTELSEQGVVSEEWGGDTQFVKVSALKGEGISNLLESIHLQAEVLELKAAEDTLAEAVVIEANLDKGKGAVATVIVTKGTLEVGSFIVVGTVMGRVRRINNYLGKSLKKATPSVPVELIGLGDVPETGAVLHAVTDEKTAREVVNLRQSKHSKTGVVVPIAAVEDPSDQLKALLDKMQAEELPSLSVIIKGDTKGSVEAINEALIKLKKNQVEVKVIYRGVGAITESDVNLAITSSAIIFGFNVRSNHLVKEFSEKNTVIVKYYNIIYELVDSVKELMVGKLPVVSKEVVRGHAEVREVFKIPKIGFVAGCMVTDGKVQRSDCLRVLRDNIVIHSGKTASLRRFKADEKEVARGYECGIGVENFSDLRVKDVLEVYYLEESPGKLDS